MSISAITYWTELIISRTGTVVSIPHHRENFDSTPSAAMTTSAVTLMTCPQLSSFAPLTNPFSIIGADARVLTAISAPASAAFQTSSRSKIFLSRMYPTLLPANWDSSFIKNPSGATILAPVISAEIQQGSGSMNSWRASFPIPSAQRTGAPIAGRFSTIHAESPFSTAVFAAIAPAGPPPMTRTSYLFFIDNLQGTQRAYFCTDSATRATLLNAEVCINQFKRTFRAD